MQCGIRYKDFMHMTMGAVLAEIDGFTKNRRYTEDLIEHSAWLFGIYTCHAINATIGNSGWFKAKGTEAHKYPNNPLLEREKQKDSPNENESVSEDEIIKYSELVFAQLEAMSVNFSATEDGQDNLENCEGATEFVVE